MRKLDLTNYQVLNPRTGKQDLPYDCGRSLISLLFNPDLKLDAEELLKTDDLARKIRDAGEFVLLEGAEYEMAVKAISAYQGYGENDVLFVRRVLTAAEVEVQECPT